MANPYSYQKRFLNINSEWQKEARKKRPLKMDERAQDAFNEARQILFNKDDEYEQIKIEYFKIENKLKEAKKKNSKKIFNAAKKELEELSLKYKTLLDKGLERDLGYGDVVLLDEYLRAMTPEAVLDRSTAAQRLKTSQTKSKIAKNRRTVKGMSPEELDALKEKVRADYLEYKNKPRKVAPSKNVFSKIYSKELKNLKPSTIRSYLKDL
jgi:hypothetical protein